MDWTYGTQTIQITERGEFKVVWTEDMAHYGTEQHFRSKAESEEAIRNALAAKAKSVPVNIAVVRRDGVSATLTGINRNTGWVIMKPDDRASRFSDFNEAYPDLPVVKELLTKIAEKEAELAELTIPLKEMAISFSIAHGRISPDQYAGKVGILNERATKAYEAAQEMAQGT